MADQQVLLPPGLAGLILDMGDNTYATRMVAGYPPITFADVTIPNGASVPTSFYDLAAGRLVGIIMPTAGNWTTANLTLQGSHDGTTGNAYDLYDINGAEYLITAAAARRIIIPLADTVGLRYVRPRSGTTGTPVNQGADRVLKLVIAR